MSQEVGRSAVQVFNTPCTRDDRLFPPDNSLCEPWLCVLSTFEFHVTVLLSPRVEDKNQSKRSRRRRPTAAFNCDLRDEEKLTAVTFAKL